MRGRDAWLPAAILLASLSLLAPWGWTAFASADTPGPIYLPLVMREPGLAEPEPCAPPDAVEQRCPGQAGWTLVCGGIGEVRELVDLGEDGTLLALGDGAARITPDGAWSAQMGQALVGLQSADRSSVAGERVAVAVGDQAQILVQRQGCWTESPPDFFDESVTYRAIQLTRYPFRNELYGWTAGEQAKPQLGEAWAAVASLAPSSTSVEAWSEWRDPVRQPDLRSLPPLYDTSTIWRYENGQYMPETWLLGAAAGARSGSFVRADRLDRPELESPEGQLPLKLLRHVSPTGRPMAYALGASLATEAGELDGTLGWRYDEDGHSWLEAPALRRSGLSPVDALIGQLVPNASGGPAPTDLWIGYREGAGQARVERLDWQSAAVTTTYPSPPLPAPGAGDAPVALSTQLVDRGETWKALEGLIYSAGDEAWRFESASGRWIRSRRRLDILGFLPDGEGGLALAAADGGARLLRYANGQLREDLNAGAQLADLPPLTRIAGIPGAVWLAGEAGLSVQLIGDLDLDRPLLRRLPPIPGLPAGATDPRDFVDLAALERGEAWALTLQQAEAGPMSQIWRFDRYSASWRPVLESPLPGVLRAIDAQHDAEGSHAWAVGDGLALWVEPDCGDTSLNSPDALGIAGADIKRPRPLGLSRDIVPDCSCQRPEGGRPQRVCRLEAPWLSLADVDQLAPGDAWAVGHWDGVGERLLRLTAGAPASVRAPITPTLTLSGSQPGGIASGSRFTALAAAGEREVWVVTRCGRGAWRELDVPEDERFRRIACGDDPPFYSAVLRFDGEGWSRTPYPGGPPTLGTELNVPIRDIDVVGLGDTNRVWLAGDWTTLARRDYAPADR